MIHSQILSIYILKYKIIEMMLLFQTPASDFNCLSIWRITIWILKKNYNPQYKKLLLLFFHVLIYFIYFFRGWGASKSEQYFLVYFYNLNLLSCLEKFNKDLYTMQGVGLLGMFVNVSFQRYVSLMMSYTQDLK